MDPLRLTVVRDDCQPGLTRGTLSVDGLLMFYTCEDEDRGLTTTDTLAHVQQVKVKGRTAIPLGTYPVAFTWSPKYRRMMPLVGSVPGFQGIRIHSGNTAADTEGCLLVGKTRTPTGVGSSRVAITELYALLQAATDAGRPISISYTRPPPA